MKNKVKSVTKKEPKEAILPDGYYNGSWGGDIIEVNYGGDIYELATAIGVKGFDIPVVVQSEDGEVTFGTINY